MAAGYLRRRRIRLQLPRQAGTGSGASPAVRGTPARGDGTGKARFVRAMFDSIAARYDVMNRLMTAGRDEAWRRLAADAVYPEAVRVALDVGAGTGDLAFAVARLAPPAHVLAVDFSAAMLRLADVKRRRLGLARRVQPALGDALALPAAEGSVDAVLTGFTLRNVEDVPAAFAECHRVLCPGGRLAILELTPLDRTRLPAFRLLFRAYFHGLVPLVGALVSGRGDAYQYLPSSVARFPDADRLRELLRAAGFDEVRYRRLALGTVALHVAQKDGSPGGQRAGGRGQGPGAGIHLDAGRLPPPGPARPWTTDSGRRTSVGDRVDAGGGVSMQEIADRDSWNALLLRLPNAHVLQTWEWGEFRRTTGWTPRRLAFWRDGEPVAAAAVLRRALPLPGWGFAYCPKGPALDYADGHLFGHVLRALAQDAARRRSIFIKLDPDVEWLARDAVATLRQARYTPSPDQVQFRSTVLTDLRGDDEALLARMRPTWRRYVRKAQREGVAVRSGSADDLPRFYELYQETADRDGFIIRPPEYYRSAWRLMAGAGLAGFFLAEVHGRAEAALVPFRFGKRAWYIWGASSAVGQRAHAPHLLQWQTMRWARDSGCETYDMWGAPDDPSDETDPTHGLYYFKQGFGGRHVRWVGAYDYATAPALYAFWNRALPRVLDVLRALKGERAPASPGWRPDRRPGGD